MKALIFSFILLLTLSLFLSGCGFASVLPEKTETLKKEENAARSFPDSSPASADPVESESAETEIGEHETGENTPETTPPPSITTPSFVTVPPAVTTVPVTATVPATTAHTHAFSAVNTVLPGCTGEGYTQERCECGETRKTNVTPPLGHAFGAYQTVEAATAEKEGREKRVCSRCGAEETRTIPKLVSTLSMEEEMLALMNADRASSGAPPLVLDTLRKPCSDLRVQEITQSFSHTRPNGSSWSTVIGELGFSAGSCWGENIQYRSNGTVSAFHAAFMNSPGHRANILDPDFKSVAISFLVQNGRTYVVQNFFG